MADSSTSSPVCGYKGTDALLMPIFDRVLEDGKLTPNEMENDLWPATARVLSDQKKCVPGWESIPTTYEVYERIYRVLGAEMNQKGMFPEQYETYRIFWLGLLVQHNKLVHDELLPTTFKEEFFHGPSHDTFGWNMLSNFITGGAISFAFFTRMGTKIPNALARGIFAGLVGLAVGFSFYSAIVYARLSAHRRDVGNIPALKYDLIEKLYLEETSTT